MLCMKIELVRWIFFIFSINNSEKALFRARTAKKPPHNLEFDAGCSRKFFAKQEGTGGRKVGCSDIQGNSGRQNLA